MLDLTSYLEDVTYSSFRHWFIREADGIFGAYNVASKNLEGVIKISNDESFNVCIIDDHDDEEIDSEVREDFIRFQSRPEYLIGQNVVAIETSYLYDKMLIGCVLQRCTRKYFSTNSDYDPDMCLQSAHRAIEWLRTTDFYRAPASSRYHEAFEGGLVSHSLKVAYNIAELKRCDAFSSVNLEDSVFCALIHDWCKIGLYESYMRNVKDENGKWIQKPEFKYRDESLTCFGHGVSSMFLAQRFFRLSTEEALAIRWHMGFCRVADSDMNELQQSNEKYPLVHLLQFADQLSITSYKKG